MNDILQRIRTDLAGAADEAAKESFQRFFKEQARFYGVKTGAVNKIARDSWREVKALDRAAIFALCEDLYRSDYTEEAFIAAEWLSRMSPRFEPGDLPLLERWIDQYINNWAKCDGLCNHAVGDLVDRYPESVVTLKRWAKAENRWLRRAAAVTLILPARRGRFLADVFDICDLLLVDRDDMVQKGYGWLLKEAGRLHQTEVFDYVVKNKKVMPRTALRYAIELMPPELKQEAMKR